MNDKKFDKENQDVHRWDVDNFEEVVIEVDSNSENEQNETTKNRENREKEILENITMNVEDAYVYIEHFLSKEGEKKYNTIWLARYIQSISMIEQIWEDITTLKQAIPRIIILSQNKIKIWNNVRNNYKNKTETPKTNFEDATKIHYYKRQLDKIFDEKFTHDRQSLKFTINALIEITKLKWDILGYVDKLLNTKRN